MANWKEFIPFLLKWETGTVRHPSEPLDHLFERARKRGFSSDPDDAGGATQSGVTLTTYKAWCRAHGRSTPSVSDLKAIPFAEWQSILKTMFWDAWRADEIRNQYIAEILVDWVWASGSYGITRPQRIIGVVADGIVGPKTLAAVNAYDSIQSRHLWHKIYADRVAYINEIIRKHPNWEKFRKGWMNRINDLPLDYE